MSAPGMVFQLAGSGFHIRVVISVPKGNPPKVLVCNFTDEANCSICDLRFKPGDHEWITKRSAIAVKFMAALPVSGFAAAGKAIRISQQPLDPLMVQKIQSHLLASKHVSEFFKTFLR